MINLTFRQNKNIEHKYMKVLFNRMPLKTIELFALEIDGIDGCRVIHHRQGCVFLYIHTGCNVELLISRIQNIACEINI